MHVRCRNSYYYIIRTRMKLIVIADIRRIRVISQFYADKKKKKSILSEIFPVEFVFSIFPSFRR